MSNSGVNKRARSTNFSISETECLVDEILQRAQIIENKRTDAVMWKEKEDSWKDLTESFNARNASSRTKKMLKVKYDGIKRIIKQKHNRAKIEQFKTGGGAPGVVVYTPWEEKLLRLISLSVEGLPSRNDCDEVEPPQPNQRPLVIHPEENIIFEINEVDHNMDYADEVAESEVTNVPTPSHKENILHEDNSSNTKRTAKVSNWDQWTPAALKTPRHSKLKTATVATSRKRTATDKYSAMANSREDLIILQKKVAEQELARLSMTVELLQKDEVRKEKEHQLKIKFATEEHNARMALLKLTSKLKMTERRTFHNFNF